MGRCERKNIEKIALIAGDNIIEPIIDITNYSGCAAQIIGPALGAGTLKLQASMDNINWFDITGATIAINAGKALVQAIQLHYGFVRAHVNLTAGPGDYKVQLLAKDF